MKKKRTTPTEKEERFIEAYLVNLNGAEAARKAGYTGKSPHCIARDILIKRHIKKIIKERLEENARKTRITAKSVLLETARISFFDPITIFDESGNMKPIRQIEEGARRVISSIEIKRDGKQRDGSPSDLVTKIKFCDKNRALDLLTRHLGLLVDRTKMEISGPGGASVDIAPEAMLLLADRVKKKAENDLKKESDRDDQ